MGNLQQSAFTYLNWCISVWLLLCIVVHICVYCLLSCVLLSLKGRSPLWNWGVTIGDLQPSCSQWAVDRHKVSWVKTGESWEQLNRNLVLSVLHYLPCLLLSVPVSELFTFGKAFAFTISCFALFCPSFATGFPLTEFYPSPPLQAMWQQVFVFTTRSFCICVSVYLCIGVSRVYLCIKSVFVYCVLCWSGTKATVALVQVAPKPPVAPTCLHKAHCVNSES